MFFRGKNDRYGLLVDIGSGSVGLAVCQSADQTQPNIIWSHREHVPLREIESVGDSSKAIVTTLMHMMMEFEGVGRTALNQHQQGAKITTVQATVAAPWAYTTTRTVKFEQDEPFEITKDLVADLASAAGQQAIDEFGQQHSLESLGIAETSRCALDTYANGYRLTEPNKQEASILSVTHATTLVRTEIIEAIKEMNDKLFGSTELQITSYMLANYFSTRLLMPDIYDACLVDITDEATEIGIVRNGSLKYSTHVAFGRASLAREISAATKVPLHEAFTTMVNYDQADKSEHEELLEIYTAYTNRVQELFKETGDRLTIPKNIYLETDTGLETFFLPMIEKAAESASKGKVKITLIKDSLQKLPQKDQSSNDTPLLVAASFFHTSDERSHFEYL